MDFQERVKRFKQIALNKGHDEVITSLDHLRWRAGRKTMPMVCAKASRLFFAFWAALMAFAYFVVQPWNSVMPTVFMLMLLAGSAVSSAVLVAFRQRWIRKTGVDWLAVWNSLEEPGGEQNVPISNV